MKNAIKAVMKEVVNQTEYAVNGVDCVTGWPIGAVVCSQYSTNTVEFLDEHDDVVLVVEEVYGLPWMDEYASAEIIATKEEWEHFVTDNPNWVEDLKNLSKTNMALIADLNKQVAKLVNQITELAEEAGLEVSINVGQHGWLDPNGDDWNSSNC